MGLKILDEHITRTLKGFIVAGELTQIYLVKVGQSKQGPRYSAFILR